jgi:hypothetical protein
MQTSTQAPPVEGAREKATNSAVAELAIVVIVSAMFTGFIIWMTVDHIRMQRDLRKKREQREKQRQEAMQAVQEAIAAHQRTQDARPRPQVIQAVIKQPTPHTTQSKQRRLFRLYPE